MSLAEEFTEMLEGGAELGTALASPIVVDP
jgi:hypothetical protein